MRVVPARRAAVAAAATAAVVAALFGAYPAAAADPTATASPTARATDGPRNTPDAPATKPVRQKQRNGAATEQKRKRNDEQQQAEQQHEQAVRAAEDAHDAAALVAASSELHKAQADLVVARAALASAREQLVEAKRADAAAATELEAAALAEARATRELAAVETRIRSRQTDLGRLARRAYQSNGSMGEWTLVLASTTPNQLADRLSFLQSVGNVGNAVIADLAEDRADLVNARAGLAAAHKRQRTARHAAAAALRAVSGTEALASAAAEQVASVVTARKAALELAKKAALEDKLQYETLIAYSGALATRIVDLAAGVDKKDRPVASGRMVLPGDGEVTSVFGPRFHPILHYVKVHTGIDFAAGDGIVYAADDGVVLLTETNVAYGNMTVVDHGTVAGQHVTTLYAHQAAIGVQPGDRVRKGQALGVIGSTGYATGPHLHFEVRVDGEPLDPAPFLAHAKLPLTLRNH